MTAKVKERAAALRYKWALEELQALTRQAISETESEVEAREMLFRLIDDNEDLKAAMTKWVVEDIVRKERESVAREQARSARKKRKP